MALCSALGVHRAPTRGVVGAAALRGSLPTVYASTRWQGHSLSSSTRHAALWWTASSTHVREKLLVMAARRGAQLASPAGPLRCSASADALPSWEELASGLPPLGERVLQDTVLDPTWPEIPEGRIVFFRDRNGWCPYCERVWIALLEKGLEFDEILIELMGRKPGWYYEISSGSTPAIRWEDGSYQGESLDILYELDRRYPEGKPLFPSDPEKLAEAEELIAAFRPTMPQGCRPSARTAFLFRGSGTPAPRSDFEATLRAVDKLLARNLEGPFFMGAEFGAVDCAWAPFLERYSVQLPLMHSGLCVRDNTATPHLTAWFDAMEERVPSYASRVQGSAYSWAAVLSTAGYGNAGVPREFIPAEETALKAGLEQWRLYAAGRSGVGSTPREEVAMRMYKNREGLVLDAAKNCRAGVSSDAADKALRVCVAALSQGPDLDQHPDEAEGFMTGLLAGLTTEELQSAAAMAEFNRTRVCVPRDMGQLPAKQFDAYLAALAMLASALAVA